ncbi:hypothetical protein [Amycolatopsis kentuckyensis]|uniref:hypothetical protein n=1 Tax=Amycolatopsis kentuckyensis TaxID=218823 RepID=UPI003564F481
MDRPSQEPPEPPEPSGSPLSFPVEAPKVAGVEPGAGSPLSFPAEVPPAEAARPEIGSPADPLDFPAQAAAPPSADPFPAPQVAQLPFPVAQLPGAAPTPPPAEPAQPTPTSEAPAETPKLLRFLPPALTAAAALMAAGGLFFPLFRLQQHVSVRRGAFDTQLTVTETAWGSRLEVPGQEAAEQAASPIGIPVLLAVILLAVAAFTAFARPRHGRWLIGAGAFFTGGVVLTVGMDGPGLSAMADGLDFEVTTAAGMWLLIAATAVAAAAAVVAALPSRNWADPALAYADTPTPPSGVAITVLPPEEPR